MVNGGIMETKSVSFDERKVRRIVRFFARLMLLATTETSLEKLRCPNRFDAMS